jgi:hypothetical protein
MIASIWMGNDNLVTLTGLQDEFTGAYINSLGSGVTVKVLNSEDGTLFAGPFTLEYIAASNGNYHGILDSSLPFVKGAAYQIVIHVDDGEGAVAEWAEDVIARLRPF